jgi:hypothetical protein
LKNNLGDILTLELHVDLPEPVSIEAKKVSEKLGLTMEELFTTALVAYLHTFPEGITGALNAVYENEESSVDPVLASMQDSLLREEAW